MSKMNENDGSPDFLSYHQTEFQETYLTDNFSDNKYYNQVVNMPLPQKNFDPIHKRVEKNERYHEPYAL